MSFLCQPGVCAVAGHSVAALGLRPLPSLCGTQGSTAAYNCVTLGLRTQALLLPGWQQVPQPLPPSCYTEAPFSLSASASFLPQGICTCSALLSAPTSVPGSCPRRGPAGVSPPPGSLPGPFHTRYSPAGGAWKPGSCFLCVARVVCHQASGMRLLSHETDHRRQGWCLRRVQLCPQCQAWLLHSHLQTSVHSVSPCACHRVASRVDVPGEWVDGG